MYRKFYSIQNLFNYFLVHLLNLHFTYHVFFLLYQIVVFVLYYTFSFYLYVCPSFFLLNFLADCHKLCLLACLSISLLHRLSKTSLIWTVCPCSSIYIYRHCHFVTCFKPFLNSVLLLHLDRSGRSRKNYFCLIFYNFAVI